MSDGPQVENAGSVNREPANNLSFEYIEKNGELILVQQPRWKRFLPSSPRIIAAVGMVTTAGLLATYVLAPSVFGKPPTEAGPQNLPSTKGITAQSTAPTIEMTPTKELVVKAPATPTEKSATATPKKESPTPAQKEPTPTKAPVKSTPTPTEIPQKRGEMIRIPAKEIVTPVNFFNYFEPASNESELIRLLNEQDKFLFPELEKPITQLKKDWLTFSGSVTLRAPFDVEKILNEAEYHKLLVDYGTGRISTEKPIRYIAYIAPGQGNLAPVSQLQFRIGIMNNKGKLELGVSVPPEAEKAMTYYEKVGDSAKKVDRLIKFGEYEGGQGTVSIFPPNTIGFGIQWMAKENSGTGNPGVTYIDDLSYYAQINDKAAVFMPPSVK